jgi:hypothetical protein
MKEFTVYWLINNGLDGLPNMRHRPSQSTHDGMVSYKEALMAHFNTEQEHAQGLVKSRPEQVWNGEITGIKENERGRTNGMAHRIFDIEYTVILGVGETGRRHVKRNDEVKVICRQT